LPRNGFVKGRLRHGRQALQWASGAYFPPERCSFASRSKIGVFFHPPLSLRPARARVHPCLPCRPASPRSREWRGV